jgi:hypothetical protein
MPQSDFNLSTPWVERRNPRAMRLYRQKKRAPGEIPTPIYLNAITDLALLVFLMTDKKRAAGSITSEYILKIHAIDTARAVEIHLRIWNNRGGSPLQPR